jgi:hypothetical protein
VEKNNDNDLKKLVERFLGSLSEQHDRGSGFDLSFTLGLAEQHFNAVRAEFLETKLKQLRGRGDVDGVLAEIAAFRKVELTTSSGISVLQDKEAQKKALEDKQRVLIRLPGPAGEFFGSELSEDSLVAFMAPPKSCKSWMMLHLGWMAMLQGVKVAYFQVGDLSRNQIFRRFLKRAVYRPIGTGLVKYPLGITCPVSTPGSKTAAVVDHMDRIYEKPITWEMAERAFEAKAAKHGDSLRLSWHPVKTVSISDIRNTLEAWDREGWVAKVCLAEGSLVLTDHGLIPIEKIRRSDRLWDGVNWINHDGPVYKGLKNVIEYQGLKATPDHEVWSEGSWRSLITCLRMGLPLTKTGAGRQAIQLSSDLLTYSKSETRSFPKDRVCLCKMHQMQIKEMGISPQLTPWNQQGLPPVLPTQAVPKLALSETGKCEAAMHEFQTQSMEALRRKGNQIFVYYDNRGLFMGPRQSEYKGRPDVAVGQDRQQRTLCPWESPLVNTSAEHGTHQTANEISENTSDSSTLSACLLCKQNIECLLSERNDIQADREALAGIKKTKSPVWDIANAGPFHRFTAQGRLVHNCIIDYPENLAPASPKLTPLEQIADTWALLRQLTEVRSCLGIVASQTNKEGFRSYYLSRNNFRGNLMILAHCTAFLGVNATDEEKASEIVRLNFIVRRESQFRESYCLHMASCLDVGNPCVLSALPQ